MQGGEERLDDLTGAVLLGGASLGLAIAVVGVGMLMAGVSLEGALAEGAGWLLGGGFGLEPFDLMELGILILLWTPVAGMVVLMLGFLWLGRLRFALTSLLVLVLLAASFALAVS